MQTATLTLSISSGSTLLVEKGSVLLSGTPLAQYPIDANDKEVPVSTPLSTPSKEIPKYLLVPMGRAIRKGDPIARRNKFFTEIIVRSPFSGVLSSLDLKRGTVTIRKNDGPSFSLTSPVPGVVKSVDGDTIVISFSGTVVAGQSGLGWASGRLVVYPSDDIKGNIVLAEASESLLAKLRALDASGIVLNNSGIDCALPYLVVSNLDMERLKSFTRSIAILDGNQKYIAITHE